MFCFMLPLMLPPQITALAWLSCSAPQSTLLQHARAGAAARHRRNPLYSGAAASSCCSASQHAPLVFLALRAGLRALPRELIEAARAAGAGRCTRAAHASCCR